MTRRLIVLESDQHGGHKLGLLNPATTLIDEDEEGNLVEWQPQLTAFQQYVWTLQSKAIESIKRLAGNDPVIILSAGDATHGNKHPQQLVSTRLSDQVIIAVNNAKPWYDAGLNLEAVRIVKGTAAHNLTEGATEILLTEQLRALYPGVDTKCLYHSLLVIEDTFGIDYAHHGAGPGIRDWTRENVLRLYLRDLIIKEVKSFRVPPQIVARGHYHTYRHVIEEDTINGQRMEFHALLLPSMCGLGEHSRQVTRSADHVTNGVIVLELHDDKLSRIIPMINTVDIRTKEYIGGNHQRNLHG